MHTQLHVKTQTEVLAYWLNPQYQLRESLIQSLLAIVLKSWQ